ncbi:Alcohol dehydrogenase [Novosphingobium resinovorum]|uniref:Alcohol dehydrogenase n=2 Tax=Novosphingobium resinovorum TaxID=158500 RepID=A0A031JNK0_9SPHN|nr:Alcohol dehydrogenase [Novosphingobium resinovorum]
MTQPGPPSALQWMRDQIKEPGESDVVIRQHAIGLNYHDVYVRSGVYRTMPFPGVLGIEAVGVVESAGSQVRGIAVGDRVGYITAAYGAYATRRSLPAHLLVPVPDAVPFDTAAAALLKGLTADMLLTRLRDVGPGSTVVVHAAAGGVGQMLTQMAQIRGASVIAAVGSQAKAELVRALGCERVAVYGDDRLIEIVMHASDGRGADIVFDGVGAATFDQSLACLKSFGQLALFGQASGPVPAISPARLAERSLAVWRPVVFHHASDLPRYRASAARLFAAIGSGVLKVQDPARFALRDAAAAHEMLEKGATTGSTVLTTCDHQAR